MFLLLFHKYQLFLFLLAPFPQYPRCSLSLPPFLFFFFLEFSVSPFQTFFNSGIKEDGGIGEIRLRDPPGIVWQSADKKKNCFGFDLSGWGQGGGRGLVGGAGRLGWQVAFLLARLLLLLSSISEWKESDIFGCSSCFLFIVLGNKYQLPVWIWYSGRIWRITTSTTNKRWESGSETITATRRLFPKYNHGWDETTLKLCRAPCLCGSDVRLLDLWVLISRWTYRWSH